MRLGLDSRSVIAGYVGQPGSGLKVGYLGAWGSLGLDSRSMWGSLGLDSRSVSWVYGSGLKVV